MNEIKLQWFFIEFCKTAFFKHLPLSRPLSCWMAWEPSIGAFYGPVGFIIFVDCMYFLSILLQLRRHPERRYELKEPSEEPQQRTASANVDVPLDAPSSQCHLLALQMQPHEVASPSSVPLSALANEHTFSAQLLGAAGALGLYAALWVFGAMAVSQDRPFDLVFTCLFGVAALALAAFMVAHHCGNRRDIRLFWSQACCSARRRAYLTQEDILLPQDSASACATAAVGVADKADGESTKCGHSSADSTHTNRSVASVRNSAHGSKLTNLQVEAAQCKPPSATTAASANVAVLDNSLTEHSIDNEIKMHVAPVEVQLRPINNLSIPPPAAANGNGGGRHHKNRARAHRASRLTVLREYAYDVPTSLDGSVQSAPHRRNHHHHYYDMAARNSRRAAYMAYRERHQSQQLQQDSSDSASLPRRSRYPDREGGGATSAAVESDQAASATASNSGKDSGSARPPGSAELDGQPKSYGLNLVSPNGSALKENGQLLPLIGIEGTAVIKTGLWKHETTV